MTNTNLIERLKEQCDRDAVEHCPDEIISLQREAIAALEAQAKQIEALQAEIVQGKRDVLEQAARKCEECNDTGGDADECAAEIRALKEQVQ